MEPEAPGSLFDRSARRVGFLAGTLPHEAASFSSELPAWQNKVSCCSFSSFFLIVGQLLVMLICWLPWKSVTRPFCITLASFQHLWRIVSAVPRRSFVFSRSVKNLWCTARVDPSRVLEERQMLDDYFLHSKTTQHCFQKSNWSIFSRCYIKARLILYLGNSFIEIVWGTVLRQVPCRS